MASAVRRLGSLSMARGCARIDAGPDTAKIGSADRVQDHARLLAVIGVRKTFPHGLDPNRTSRYLKWTARRIASDISQRYGSRSRVAASRNWVHRGREESSSGPSLRPCEIFCSIRASTFAVTALS